MIFNMWRVWLNSASKILKFFLIWRFCKRHSRFVEWIKWMHDKVNLFIPFGTKDQFKPSLWLGHHKLLESLIKIKSYHRWYVCQDQIRHSAVENLSYNHRKCCQGRACTPSYIVDHNHDGGSSNHPHTLGCAEFKTLSRTCLTGQSPSNLFGKSSKYGFRNTNTEVQSCF